MYDFCECGQPLTQWTGKHCLENEDWEKDWGLIIAIWQCRIEFSSLTELAFNQEQSLIENLVSTIAIT